MEENSTSTTQSDFYCILIVFTDGIFPRCRYSFPSEFEEAVCHAVADAKDTKVILRMDEHDSNNCVGSNDNTS